MLRFNNATNFVLEMFYEWLFIADANIKKMFNVPNVLTQKGHLECAKCPFCICSSRKLSIYNNHLEVIK